MQPSVPASQRRIRDHFAAIAPRYRALREFDRRAVGRVVQHLRRWLDARPAAAVLDVGAGTGRYTEAVVEQLREHCSALLHAAALDASRHMMASRTTRGRKTHVLHRVVGAAEDLPFGSGTFDAVLTFNALHHFELDDFLRASARVLRSRGVLIAYTRTPEQNRRTVWGRLFPDFAERETRLLPLSRLRAAVNACGEFLEPAFETIPWWIRTSMSRLEEQARAYCYSTLQHYTPAELESAIDTFLGRLSETYDDPSDIVVRNDHLLLTARRI